MLKKIGLVIRTVVHFTPPQVFFLAVLIIKKKILFRWKGLIRKWYGFKIRKSDSTKIRILNLGPPEYHKLLGSRHQIHYDWKEDTVVFNFLNNSLSCKNRIDWNPGNKTFLWRYNLHYFDYAYELGVEYLDKKDEKYYFLFKKLVLNWCENNPLLCNTGWDPYPTSLRIVNWIKSYHLFSDLIEEDTAFKYLLLKMIYLQTFFLEANIEYHLRNNHIIENARALFLAGSFFIDKNSRRWQKKGQRILWKELHHQVANDGGQFELSPMYHAVVLLNYIDVVLVSRSINLSIPDWVEPVLLKMAQFLQFMQMPDSEIAYLNDAARGMTVSTAKLMQALNTLGIFPDIFERKELSKFVSLPSSGYYILQTNDGQTKCIFDCGTLGPDYQPGHGHCDTLSFVWAHQGQRVIVDSGVDDYYRPDEWRAYYRSTRAHNTIEIDSKEQSEIWGNFRVGRRAHPLNIQTNQNDTLLFVQGSHDGYYDLSEKVLHRRTICFFCERALIIFDEITGKQKHTIQSYLHFHPEFELDEHKLIATGKNFNVRIFPFGNFKYIKKYYGENDPLQGWFSHEFGKHFPNYVLVSGGEIKLPAYLGYCLLPAEKSDSSDDYSLKCNIKTEQCNLELKMKKQHYQIECSSNGIFLVGQHAMLPYDNR